MIRSLSAAALVGAMGCWATTSPASADWSSTSSSQLILRVDPGQGSAQAAGASYAVQGSGLAGTPVLNSGAGPAPGLALRPIQPGATFQLNMSVKPADPLAGPSISTDQLPAYSEVTVQAPGSAAGLSGEVTSPTAASASPGGPGSTATVTQSNTFTVFQ